MRAPWLVIALLCAAGFWALDLAVVRGGVPHPLDDTWEYGVAARHLLAGDGWRTGVIYPPLWTLRDTANTVPVLIHGPLAPLLVAPLVGLLGPRAIDHAAWLGALFAVLCMIPLARLAERRSDAATALAALALWTFSPLTIAAVNHDLILTVGAFLIVAALDLLWRPSPRALAAGLAAGLASLARPEAALAAAILLVSAPRRAWAPFALGFLACAAPWWLHQAQATGQPGFNLSSYLLLGYWEPYPGLSVLRDFHLTPAAWPGTLARALPGLWPKWLHFAPSAIGHALTVPTIVTGALAAVGCAVLLRDPARAQRARVAVLLGCIPLAIITAGEHSPRYVTPFLPLWAFAAAWGARAVFAPLAGAASRPRLWPVLLLVLAIPSTGGALSRAAREGRAAEEWLARERIALASRANEADSTGGPPAQGADRRLVFTDTPDFVAWTTGRPTVWVTRDEYARLPLAGAGPAPDGTASAVRGAGEDVWFHTRMPGEP